MFPPKGFPLKHLYTDMQMYKSDVQKYKENKDKEKREKKLKIWLFKQKKKHAEKPVVPVSNQEARIKEAEKRRAMKKVSVRIPGAPWMDHPGEQFRHKGASCSPQTPSTQNHPIRKNTMKTCVIKCVKVVFVITIRISVNRKILQNIRHTTYVNTFQYLL